MIKRIKYLIGDRIIIFVMLFCILFLSCKDEFRSGRPSSNTNPEEIFRGIFFAEGPVVKAIPELSDFELKNFTNDKKILDEAYKNHSIIIENFKSEYPGYIETFASKILSHNPIIIQTTLKDGAGKLQLILKRYYESLPNEERSMLKKIQGEMMTSLAKSGINKTNPHEVAEFMKQTLEGNKSLEILNKKRRTELKASEKSNSQEGVVIALAAAVALAVVVWSVAAVVEGVVLWTVQKNENNSESDNLLQEQLVNSIVENL